MAKVMEGFARSRLITQTDENIDPRQYAREGHSTSFSLFTRQQTGECAARIFFADLTSRKLGFDLVDHNALLKAELLNFNNDPVLVNWLRHF